MKKTKKLFTKLTALAVSFSLAFSATLTGCGLFDDDEYEIRNESTEANLPGSITPTGDGSGTNNPDRNISDSGEQDLSEIFSDEIVRDTKVKLKGNGEDQVTIMVYMNGSDLESEYSEATTDLKEMIKAGSSDKVNVVVQTMGTKKWDSELGIASDRSQRYELSGNGLKLVKDDLGQMDCTATATLQDFIKWGAQNYPADRYILIFWDHGGGPVYGYGYDEYQDYNASLTIDEIQSALKAGGVYFDFIGMDCCIMACLEMCMAVYDYCDYTILSEDFESGIGWYYTDWLSKLYSNSSIPTTELGKMIVDDMVNANEKDPNGDKAILALVDESKLKVLFAAWVDFAYENANSLLGVNYSQRVKKTGRAHPALNKGLFSDWLTGGEETTMSDYFITDIMAVASNVDSEKSAALASAVANAIIYVKATEADASLTGLSVTLPYGDDDFYGTLQYIFSNVGIDSEYIAWLNNFTSASGTEDFYDYDSWDDWFGWDDYDDDYDWSDWDYYDDDSYWEDDTFWSWSDLWDYDDSWNSWFNDNDEYYDGNSWNYNDDDWYYDDWSYDDDNGDWYYEDDYDSSYYDDSWWDIFGSSWWDDDDDWDDDDWDFDDWDDDDDDWW